MDKEFQDFDPAIPLKPPDNILAINNTMEQDYLLEILVVQILTKP
jgi:hypothetical protein